MRSKFKLQIITIISFVLFFYSCSQKGEKKKLKLTQFEIKLDGPLFEGSNTGQYEVKNLLDSFLKANNLTIDNVKNAALTSVSISSSDSNFNTIQSISLQLASEKSDMVQLGIINPIPAGQSSVNLSVAKTQEKLMDAIKQPNFFIVSDAIINKDIEASISIKYDLEFEIEIKK